MKTTRSIVLMTIALAISAAGLLAEKVVAGPKGGRLLETAPHRAEFLVNAGQKVEITFYDAALKAVPPGEQVVTVTAEPKSGRAKLDLEKTATGYVSKTVVPTGAPYRVVVQIRPSAEAKPQNFRIDLDLEKCGGCSRQEYACSCHE